MIDLRIISQDEMHDVSYRDGLYIKTHEGASANPFCDIRTIHGDIFLGRYPNINRAKEIMKDIRNYYNEKAIGLYRTPYYFILPTE